MTEIKWERVRRERGGPTWSGSIMGALETERAGLKCQETVCGK